MIEEILSSLEFWKYVSIPFVAAVVGWVTNWIAIKMTFLPLEFFGVRPIFGWQGIIPSKATKMAGIFVDKSMRKLGRLSELFQQMDPDKISHHIIEYIEPRVEEYVDDIMTEHNAVLWDNMPTVVREQLVDRVRRQLPGRVERLMAEVGEKVEDLMDLKHMIVTQLVRDKALLNRLFQESGSKEFAFIIRSGLYFGFLFGLVQLGVWYFYPAWWILPFFGTLVGYATNWIALNVIFRPLHPRRLLFWDVQGLFLRRQKEVTVVWCKMVTSEILTLRNFIDSMLHGPGADRTRKIIRKHIRPVVDEAVGGLGKAIAQVAVGVEGFSKIKDSVDRKAMDVSLDPFKSGVFTRERAQVVEQLLRERMEAMPSEDFQDLLRPCFQEEEIKLILAGAGLGCCAGVAQLVFVFGGF